MTTRFQSKLISDRQTKRLTMSKLMSLCHYWFEIQSICNQKRVNRTRKSTSTKSMGTEGGIKRGWREKVKQDAQLNPAAARKNECRPTNQRMSNRFSLSHHGSDVQTKTKNFLSKHWQNKRRPTNTKWRIYSRKRCTRGRQENHSNIRKRKIFSIKFTKTERN